MTRGHTTQQVDDQDLGRWEVPGTITKHVGRRSFMVPYRIWCSMDQSVRVFGVGAQWQQPVATCMSDEPIIFGLCVEWHIVVVASAKKKKKISSPRKRPHTTSEFKHHSNKKPKSTMSIAKEDVVIVWCKRTAVTKAKRGGFKDSGAVEMLTPVLKALLEDTRVDATLIGDIVVGSVLAPGSSRAVEVRQAAFLAGVPEEVPVRTVNRQCSSGLQAIADVAAAINAGYYDAGIAGGVESMTQNPFIWTGSENAQVMQTPAAKNCLLNMGITSENVAAKFGVSREVQDEFAVASHLKAINATDSGRFKDEIIPVEVSLVGADGASKQVVIDTDEGFRRGTTYEGLAKLKPVFNAEGSTTAGNCSQLSDGAAAALVMRRSLAEELGLPILAIFRSFAAVGVAPEIMGVGPAAAIPVALKKAGLTAEDIDLFEINEAFASQAKYCIDNLKLDMEKVNVNGGAIALGHPLGCTGARMTATLLSEMSKRNSRFGVVSMCVGSGMGAAAVFESPRV
jgi:acetyl-CoA acyltransferase 1